MRLEANFSSAKLDATRKGITKKTLINNMKDKRGDVREIIFFNV